MNTEDVVGLITTSYGGDLQHPIPLFVDRSVEERPYEGLIDQIRSITGITPHEYSDPNTFVCFAYGLTEGDRRWALEMSMLAPLAVLARGGDHGWQRLLQPTDDDLIDTERMIFDVLISGGFGFPTRAVLEQRLKIALDFTAPENTRIYHALFSDEDFLPWQSSPPLPVDDQ